MLYWIIREKIICNLNEGHDDELENGDLAQEDAEGDQDGGSSVLTVEEACHGDVDDRLMSSFVPGVKEAGDFDEVRGKIIKDRGEEVYLECTTGPPGTPATS